MASDGEISCASDPNFAVIYSFLKVFGKIYVLEIPSIAKLQELIENTQEVLDPLKELHLRLLRRALKSVQSNRWERSLIKFCHQYGYHQEAWEIERFSYKKASTQVKLKVLKVLLEYQFTCHNKFKNSVNALCSKDLRLNPIGRDKFGCVYWLQIDNEANLRLYRENQDEETWMLIAKNRDELLKIISSLKNGEEITGANESFTNEESNSADNSSSVKIKKSEGESNEEFLSPESEGDEQDERKDDVNLKTEVAEDNCDNKNDTKQLSDKSESDIEKPCNKNLEDINNTDNTTKIESDCLSEEVGSAVEEPVMIVTGEGSGVECDSSYIIGDEIIEPVMFIWGEGSGETNYTGNPEVNENLNSVEDGNKDTPCDSVSKDHCGYVNGEISESVTTIIKPKNNKRHVKSSNKSKLKSDTTEPPVSKRMLNKQCNDTADTVKLESDSKKPCMWYTQEKDHCESDKSSNTDHDKNCGDNTLDTTELQMDKEDENVKQSRSKTVNSRFRKKNKIRINRSYVDNQLKLNKTQDEINVVEKRKSSISSTDGDKKHSSDVESNEVLKDTNVDSSVCENIKVETDVLPFKKLKLENSKEPDDVSQCDKSIISKENSTLNIENVVDQSEVSECPNENTPKLEDKIGVDENLIQNKSVGTRKKMKVLRSKFKKAKFKKSLKKEEYDEFNKNNVNKNGKTSIKSLKRSLAETYKSERRSSESVSEAENEEPQIDSKRLKTKPKKISISSRKNVEAKRMSMNSSESEEETLMQKKEKKDVKKLKKKSKAKNTKQKNSKTAQDLDGTPVRQSRRIAQMKIKEEADRRHMEEVALRELKKIHKDKIKQDDKEEEEWVDSAASSEEEVQKKQRRPDQWHADDSSHTSSDSDSEEPLFEPEEPDLDFSKSDHEFSPESDLENGEPVEPLRRARTLNEDKDDGYCVHCGSGEQPEWILLCDDCNAGYHASCLKPILFLIPEGDWFCPPCQHAKLILALEEELVKYDELSKIVEEEKEKRKEQEIEEKKLKGDETNDVKEAESDEAESSSECSSSSSDGAVYRLRERRQLPVSYRAREYDRLMSSAIKEEYVEPTSSAGNQGRGKDISTIIEAAEEEKLKAVREGQDQGQFAEIKKMKRKVRRKPRKLNSLEVPSEDDDETDEDFKDTGMYSSSEEISSDADRDTGGDTDNGSSDSLPIRRSNRSDKKDRRKIVESPELKKKKGVFNDTSSESSGTKDWSKKKKKHKTRPHKFGPKKMKKRRGLTQYDAEGNVIRSRVTYGGLSGDEGENDWSPKHRTRQKKIDYTEMPNTESEDEMHKSSGKHMPDSSDEFRLEDSEASSSDSDSRKKKKSESEQSDSDKHKEALRDLIKKTAVVPLQKLPDDVTKAKQEALEACLNAQAQAQAAANGTGGHAARASRGRGGRTTRGSRGSKRAIKPRDTFIGPRAGADNTDETLSKLVGVKIKDLTPNLDGGTKPAQLEREKKRLEKEARQAEKEARKLERLQKKEEKEKLKEQRAKEREEKRLAKIALQESRRQRKEMGTTPVGIPVYGAPPHEPLYPRLPAPHPPQHPAPRLQVRPELRGMRPDLANVRAPRPPPHLDPPAAMRQGTLSVAGSPQPFKPTTEEPSIITRMPHMISQQYRTPMMYPPGNSPYAHPRMAQNMSMYMHHQSHNMNHAQGMGGPVPNRHPYHIPGQNYYPSQMRGVPPGYPPGPPGPPHAPHAPPPHRHPPSIAPPLAPAAILPQPVTSPSEVPGTVKIKSEIKTEPEFPHDSESPSNVGRASPPKEEAPRISHPKIKHTENKDRKSRYPLGPYAPQYGPYGPYAPPGASTSLGDHGPIALQQRPPTAPHPAGSLPHRLPPTSGVHHFMSPSLHEPSTNTIVRARIPSHPSLPLAHMEQPNAPGSPHSSAHVAMVSRVPAHSQALPPSPHYTPPPMGSQHPPSGHPTHSVHPVRSHATVSSPSPSNVSSIASSRATPTPPQNVPSSITQPVHFAALRRLNSESPTAMSPIKQISFPGNPHGKIQIPVSMASPSGTPPTGEYAASLNIDRSGRQFAEEPIPNEKNVPSLLDSHKAQQVPIEKTLGQDHNSNSRGNTISAPALPAGDPNLSKTNSALPYPPPLIKTETDDTLAEHQPKMELSNVHQELEPEQSENVPVEESAPSEEISVFGGLVSYFSSQREDDIDT